MTIVILAMCVVAAWPLSRPVVRIVNNYVEAK